MKESLGTSMKSHNSSRIDEDVSGQASIFCVLICPLGGYRIRLHGNVYDLTPQTHNALSSTGHTGKKMKRY